MSVSRSPLADPHNPMIIRTLILYWKQVFSVFSREGINVRMMSQGASKTNISLVVEGSLGQKAVQVLHSEFCGAPQM